MTPEQLQIGKIYAPKSKQFYLVRRLEDICVSQKYGGKIVVTMDFSPDQRHHCGTGFMMLSKFAKWADHTVEPVIFP